uniref:Cytochrome b n=1 Tax=Pseudoterranova azarasi TaxID=172675 RepID=A0A0F7H0F4_PSEUI|nr:cytochrome b [Pseudoterranova azarasi]AKG63661.1 cytochrome b [Pseudoterranova azarasi]
MKGLFAFVNSMVVSLPSSKSLTLNWNYGSMLGVILVFQILTGTFLAFYYTNDGASAFGSVQYIMYEVNFGWVFRLFHSNGASLFFIFLYLHIFKGLFFFSYRLKKVWASGLFILLLLMAEAFMGYVLVWAQMSFWASVVITSLLSVIPIWGPAIVTWIWSGFTVSGLLVSFFLLVHFLLPYGLLVFVLAHLLFLHETGSTSKLYCHGDYDKICFFPEFWVKDALNLVVWFVFVVFCFLAPYLLGDPEMFIESDPYNEAKWGQFKLYLSGTFYMPMPFCGLFLMKFWVLQLCLVGYYFFFFLFLFMIMFLCYLSWIFLLLFTLVMLSWLGQCLVEEPFITLSMVFSAIYFVLVLTLLFIFFITKFIFK